MNKKLKLTWLCLSCLAIIITIFIGGYTRLSSSGLSITEWKPVTGIYPPLSYQEWVDEFNKYKNSPEWKEINNKITFKEFKYIYWVEYIHRMAGRSVGIIFILPFIIFLLFNKLNDLERKISYLASLLIVLQGFLGWYMVSSGLSDQPFVSHFRLAIHLSMAVIIYCLIFLLININLRTQHNKIKENTKIYKIGLLILLILIILQIFFGGLVAGLGAGYVYNNFPSMIEGEIFPIRLIYNIDFYNRLHIQFLHRISGYLIFIISLILFLYTKYYIRNKLLILYSFLILLTIISQIFIGIFTLIYIIPIHLALLHQIFPILIISLLIRNLYLLV